VERKRVHGCRRSGDWWEADGQEQAYRDKSDFNGEAFMSVKLSLGTEFVTSRFNC
jgi:hypothetical protein